MLALPFDPKFVPKEANSRVVERGGAIPQKPHARMPPILHPDSSEVTQIVSIGGLLAGTLGRRLDDGTFRERDDGRWAN
jgi:hypothetical protein